MLGGAGTLLGPIVGAGAAAERFRGFQERIPGKPSSNFGVLIVCGGVFMPEGIVGGCSISSAANQTPKRCQAAIRIRRSLPMTPILEIAERHHALWRPEGCEERFTSDDTRATFSLSSALTAQ